MRLFDSATDVLHRGTNLVEASAGTGKTYAISMLVLRFITELEVPIDQILIVTFTKAATEELKERIRSRIVEGRNILLSKIAVDAQDTMGRWAAGVQEKDLFIALLNRALLDIDKASIHTIHGFCQRMLQEQALESDQLFDVDLVADISQARHQVAYDFWRTRMYHLAPIHCAIVTSQFKTPEELLLSVKDMSAGYVLVEPHMPPFELILEGFDDAYQDLSLWFHTHCVSLQDYYQRSIEEGVFKSAFAGDFSGWWDGVHDYFSGRSQELPDNLDWLSRVGLAGQLDGRRVRGEEKKALFLHDWPLADAEIKRFNESVARIILGLRVKLFHRLKQEVDRRLRQLGRVSFNDLIVRLSSALKKTNGRILSNILAKRYRVGLIDEFQDTDSAQYHIFSTIFSGSSHYLYLIGDPKQAIYKFRGADIFSYFKAKEAADYQLTLDKNYRSHPLLVQAVNKLFTIRSRPFLLDSLSYHPVNPAREASDGHLAVEGKELHPMVTCQLQPHDESKDGRWSSGKAADHMMAFVLDEIAMLLHGRQPVMITDRDGSRPLTAKDIGILVRSNRQAARYYQALTKASIPCIITGRQTVFDSRECEQLLVLMQSLCTPGDSRQIKNALALDWFGFNGQQLYRLFQDEFVFDQFISRFYSYSRQWHKRGFLSMMNTLLVSEGVFDHLAEAEMPQRRLTNIHHLLELIQTVESMENFGPDQTLLWLQAMRDENEGMDETELRLESDEETVKIVTMHSAKGLEYPIVFCPFLWYRTSRLKKETSLVSCHNEEHELLVDLGSADFDLRREQAVREEMAEELRLFYVAVTRASLRCYTMWADVKSFHTIDDSFHSAFGYLFFPEGQCSFEDQRQKLETFCLQGDSEYRSVPVGEGLEQMAVSHVKPIEQHLQARQLTDRIVQSDWQMSSYTALASLTVESPESDGEYGEEAAGQPEESDERVIDLPAGPRFGNVVHELLENISFRELANKQDYSILVDRACDRYGVKADKQNLMSLLHRTVTTPLLPASSRENTEAGFHLALLNESTLIKEMGFYFGLSKSTSSQINDILVQEPTFAPLSHRTMGGYLTGFVDLVCLYDGRFYILDYKTNLLGEFLGDYTHDNMVRSMRAHNYGLQYWIYTLVLHRYLSKWYPGYSYEQHFGGVLYLFVRGMSKDRPANGVFYTMPDPDVLRDLSTCLGGAASA